MKNSDIKILPYTNKYKADVQNICLDTADENARKYKRQKLLLSTYCDYYIENEQENCFIAYDEKKNRAVGYILCARDYKRYLKVFYKKYFKKSFDCGFDSIFESFSAMAVPLAFYRKYPAHLHIDILPEYQGMKIGTRLMNSLIENLKNKNVKGVMLGVDTKNKRAICFYQKCGFKEIVKSQSGLVMAMKIDERVF